MCDLPEFSTETWHTCNGRGKPRRCEECRGPIVPGQLYFAVAGKWEGEMWTYRFHKMCKEISDGQRKVLGENGVSWEDMPAFGEMVEYVDEDARNIDDFPTYWPRGVYISTKALAAHVAALTVIELATAARPSPPVAQEPSFRKLECDAWKV